MIPRHTVLHHLSHTKIEETEKISLPKPKLSLKGHILVTDSETHQF